MRPMTCTSGGKSSPIGPAARVDLPYDSLISVLIDVLISDSICARHASCSRKKRLVFSALLSVDSFSAAAQPQ